MADFFGGITKKLGFSDPEGTSQNNNKSTLATRLGFSNKDATFFGGLFITLIFFSGPVWFFLGFSELTYEIDEARDAQKAMCDRFNDPQYTPYIALGTGGTARDDGVTQQICQAAGCEWGVSAAQLYQCAPGGTAMEASTVTTGGTAITGDGCGLTVHGYGDKEENFRVGFVDLTGYRGGYQDCRDKADLERSFGMAYVVATMIVIGWYYVHNFLHMLMYESPSGGEQNYLINNHALRGVVELGSLLLPLPLLAITNTMYAHTDELEIHAHPSGLIFLGWICLVFYITSHASINGGETRHSLLGSAIGSRSDNANGKTGGKRKTQVKSIHW